jgi:predicted class III extradiol MEMO1 family dioxygenase
MLYTAEDEDSQEFLNKPIKTSTFKNNETNLGELNRQSELSQSLLSESKMETSEVMIHGA